MARELKYKILMYYSIVYILFFTGRAILNRNYEFLYYTSVIILLILFVGLYYKSFQLSFPLLVGLTILGSLHLLGGDLFIGGIKLYDFWLIRNILRYDNIMHALGTFLATLIVYNLISPHLQLKKMHHPILCALFLILIVAGIGTINEILELGAVIFLNAAEQVGDYFNNTLDLIFNVVGSVIACVFIYVYYKKPFEFTKNYIKRRLERRDV